MAIPTPNSRLPQPASPSASRVGQPKEGGRQVCLPEAVPLQHPSRCNRLRTVFRQRGSMYDASLPAAAAEAAPIPPVCKPRGWRPGAPASLGQSSGAHVARRLRPGASRTSASAAARTSGLGRLPVSNKAVHGGSQLPWASISPVQKGVTHDTHRRIDLRNRPNALFGRRF